MVYCQVVFAAAVPAGHGKLSGKPGSRAQVTLVRLMPKRSGGTWLAFRGCIKDEWWLSATWVSTRQTCAGLSSSGSTHWHARPSRSMMLRRLSAILPWWSRCTYIRTRSTAGSMNWAWAEWAKTS